MKLHASAALSLNQRRRLVCRVVKAGWSLTQAAEAAEVSDRTAAKWVGRYRAEGEAGLLDRSSAPGAVANRTDERRVEAIAALEKSSNSSAAALASPVLTCPQASRVRTLAPASDSAIERSQYADESNCQMLWIAA